VATARVAVGGDRYGGGGGLGHGGGFGGRFKNRQSGEEHNGAGRIRTVVMWATGKSLEPPSNGRKNREAPMITRL
jgi:hypothetical protein